jgi:hypothetical protein
MQMTVGVCVGVIQPKGKMKMSYTLKATTACWHDKTNNKINIGITYEIREYDLREDLNSFVLVRRRDSATVTDLSDEVISQVSQLPTHERPSTERYYAFVEPTGVSVVTRGGAVKSFGDFTDLDVQERLKEVERKLEVPR